MSTPRSLLLHTRALQTLLLVAAVSSSSVPDFHSKDAMPEGNLADLRFVSRIMVPYGPNIFGEPPLQTANTTKPSEWQGYGFGMGAGEELTYDTQEKYAYVASAVGYVTVVDFAQPQQPVLTDYAISFDDRREEISNIKICPKQGWLFTSIASRGVVAVYRTVQRQQKVTDPDDPQLELLVEFAITGGAPSNLLPNANCTILAVSNENEKDVVYGTVTLLRDLHLIDKGKAPTQTNIPMDRDAGDGKGWDDDYVLRKGLHMPLTNNSLTYWDDHSHIAEEANFSSVRNAYRSSLFLEGEYLAWASPEEDELLVNLQVNNGLLRINVNENRALSLSGYGLKDHGSTPIDINANDKTCNLASYRNLFALRNPDSIRTLRYNGKSYLLTANEGAYKKFGEYNDRVDAMDLFVNSSFGLPNIHVPTSLLEDSLLFNAGCEGPKCVGGVRLSLGSSAIDYELKPSNPTFMRMVMFGGRGWTIFELPDNPEKLLKLVFDSGDDMATSVCEQIPWAYNADTDEERAPTNTSGANHTLWNYNEGIRETLLEKNDPSGDGCIDQGDGTPGACPMNASIDTASDGGGVQVEHIETGVACGRLVAVVASEKSSVAWLYDMTNIASPNLIKTFHLSPASEGKSPGVAYNDGTIGEIDPENFTFLSKEDSPSGKAAILFGGSHSGTLSYWEFDCLEEDRPVVGMDLSKASRVLALTFSFTITAASSLLLLFGLQ